MLQHNVAIVLVPLANNNCICIVHLEPRCLLEGDDNIRAVMEVNIQKAMSIPDIFLCVKTKEYVRKKLKTRKRLKIYQWGVGTNTAHILDRRGIPAEMVDLQEDDCETHSHTTTNQRVELHWNSL